MVDTAPTESVGFIVLCSALVFIMTPGLGLYYSGMSRNKNALSLIMVCMLAYCIVALQWTLFGFSLSFSETGSPFIGNFDLAVLKDIGKTLLPLTAPGIPSIAFCLYQLQFATVTAGIIFGSVAERVRIIPAMIFVFFWTTFVYDFVAYWTWGARGWVKNMACLGSLGLDSTPCGIGSYDYAGGGPVHVASGVAGLAYAMIVGKRRKTTSEEFKPHNLTLVFVGTAVLWFGWFGFNGGSALAANPRAAYSAFVTVLSSSCAALSWTLTEYCYTKKISAEAFCAGAIAGLVVITPASGYVVAWSAIVMGLSGGVVVFYGARMKKVFGVDDSLDAFGVHAVGGIYGNILTGIFAQKWAGDLDNTVINGGWINGNFIQVGYQIAGTAAIAAWSFVISYIILIIMNKIPGLELRASEYEETLGSDRAEMGEVAYEVVSTSMLMDSNLKSSPKMIKLPTQESNSTMDEV